MGCCGDREKFGSASNEQKWDYINLSDFRSTSCWSPLSYAVVYYFFAISVGVYAVDIFTAANLLFFGRWSSQVKPALPFEISRWVFAGCIILSWIFLAYRWWRAIRAMKTGVITASYLDPLAVRVESMRIGKRGQGWHRFLVFAALTKGRKGSEYVALFTYFSFEAWLRICFAEGPRQVINALTLYSVMRADLLPAGAHSANDGHTPVVQFFVNVQILANHNKQQAVILFGMLYTLVIWVFSAISLFLAFFMYITFLWHHIPSADGSLTHYCRRKIESRLHKIVMDRVNKALAKDKKAKAKQTREDAKAGIARVASKRQPTVPVLDTDADIPPPPTSRIDTQTEFSPFASRPASPFSVKPSNTPGILDKEPTIPNVLGISSRPTIPSRTTTQSSLHSDNSYASDAPLMSSAGGMGHGGQTRSESRNGPSRIGYERTLHGARPPPNRSYTGDARSTQRSYISASTRAGPPSWQNTEIIGRSPAPYPSQPRGRKPMPLHAPFDLAGRRPESPGPGPGPIPEVRLPSQEYEMHPPGPDRDPNFPPANVFPAPQWSAQPRSVSAGLTRTRQPAQAYRPTPIDYFGESRVPSRAGTAPLPRPALDYDEIYDAYGASSRTPQAVPDRPNTAGPGPGPGAWNGPNGSRRPIRPHY